MNHAIRPLSLILALAALLGACTLYHQGSSSGTARKTSYGGHGGH